MTDKSTIRAEMHTRAANLPGDSGLPANKLGPAPKRNRAWVWVACAAVVLGVIWFVRRG